jgi:hydroxyethylthiazole kinase-like uncharacterized protein yjeF
VRPFVTAEEMGRLDEATMKKNSISSFELMDRVTDEIVGVFSSAALAEMRNVLVLCGPGNNGGDGYRVAEKLRVLGRRIFVLEVMTPKSPDCVRAKALYRGNFIQKIPKEVDVVVDAIFGSGGRADLPARVAGILDGANRAKVYRVALDVPSGVDTENGRVHADSFCADLTITIAYPKSVFVFEEVAECLGDVKFVCDFFKRPAHESLIAIEDSDFYLPPQKRTGHKGLYGRCGVVGGSAKTPGAAFLAAEAAHRFGAGYVTVYFAEAMKKLEISVKDAGFLLRVKWNAKDLREEDSLVIGCGGAPKNFSWKNVSMPCVVDAAALGDVGKIARNLRVPALLTPHPGEAAMMLGTETKRVQADRLSAVTELAEMSRQSVYLKGAPGLLKLADETQACYVNLSANPTFSKAGSGDVLAGIVGGALAIMVTEQNVKAGQRANGSQESKKNVRKMVGKKNEKLVTEQFRKAVVSGLVFQKAVGNLLRHQRATMVTDQLNIFSEAFRWLQRQ